METPFIFGKIATEKNFTDRELETANFAALFTSELLPQRRGEMIIVLINEVKF